MPKALFLFIKRLTIFSIIIVIISFLILRYIPGKFITPMLPFILLFFFFISIISYYVLIKSAEQRFARFVSTFMLATFVKLMLYLGILMFYIFLINSKDAVPFIGSFFIYYLLYTVFETVYLLITTKKNSFE